MTEQNILILKIAKRLYQEQSVLIEALIKLSKEKDKEIEQLKNQAWCCTVLSYEHTKEDSN